MQDDLAVKNPGRAPLETMNKRVKTLHAALLVLMMTLVTFVISALFGLVVFWAEQLFSLEVTHAVSPLDTDVSFLIFGVTFVPIIETAVFQHWIIRWFRVSATLGDKTLLAIVASAAAFGLAHYGSIVSVLHGFLIGLILAYSYIVKDSNPKTAFWVVTAIHALRNLIAGVLGILWA